MTTVDIPGSLGGLDALAGQLENAANDINSVRDRVATNGLDGEWSGQAADAFRSTLHRLPGELATVGGAFGEAMGTIRNFAGRLAELQQQAQWYEEKMEESERDLQAANARHDEAAESLRSANRAQVAATDPVSLTAAKRAVDLGESLVRQAVADVEDIGGQISQLNSGADSIRHEYEEAVRSCCSALDAACPPGESLWSGLRHGFDDMTGGAIRLGGAVWHGTDRGLHDAEKGLDDAAHFTVHEFDEHWGEIRHDLEIAGEVLMVAVLVVSVIALSIVTVGAADAVFGALAAGGGADLAFAAGASAAADAAVDGGAAAGVEAAASGLGAFSIADNAIITGGDNLAAQTGDKQYGKDVPGDVFSTALGAFASVTAFGGAGVNLLRTSFEDVWGDRAQNLIDQASSAPHNPYIDPPSPGPTSFLLDLPPSALFE